MSYEIPTASELKTKFPAFAGIADPTIDAAIEEAAGFVDATTWREADYKPAVSYLAAHLLIISGALTASANSREGAATLLQSGIISEMRVHDVVVKSGVAHAQATNIATSGITDTSLKSTDFGRRFLDYQRRNIIPFRVI